MLFASNRTTTAPSAALPFKIDLKVDLPPWASRITPCPSPTLFDEFECKGDEDEGEGECKGGEGEGDEKEITSQGRILKKSRR